LAHYEASLADSEKQQEALNHQIREAAAGWQKQLEREMAALRQSPQELHCRHEASVVGSVQRLAALKQQMQEAAAELQKRQDELQVQLVDVKAPAILCGQSADTGAARSEAESRH
jgi:hypothetical protein